LVAITIWFNGPFGPKMTTLQHLSKSEQIARFKKIKNVIFTAIKLLKKVKI